MKGLELWPDEVLHCSRCKERIQTERVVYLELKAGTNVYTDPDKVGFLPHHQSQGCFPFGADCAKRILAGAAQ